MFKGEQQRCRRCRQNPFTSPPLPGCHNHPPLPPSHPKTKPPPSPRHTRISNTWRALELGCTISALGGNWLLHTICSSFPPTYTPLAPAAATTLLLTTANPAGISFEANSPLTADHFFFIWKWSHRPLMSPPACGGIKRGLIFERAPMFHV